MYPFVAVRLISDKSFYRPHPYILGRVEVRPAKFDSSVERNALEESMKRSNELVQLDMASRMVTIVKATTTSEVNELAAILFEETLDILIHMSVGIGRFTLTNIGFVRDLSSGKITPYTPTPQFGPFPVFHIVPERFPHIDFAEYVLANRDLQLIQRLLRSSHWSRMAQLETNLQLKALYRWFSMEAGWKVDKNDDIVPKIMLAIGFPIGNSGTLIDRQIISRLQSHPRYRYWRREIRNRLEQMRSLRNDSVHTGFRPWDIEPTKLQRLEHLSILCCSRSISLFSQAVRSGLCSATEAWEYAPFLLEMRENLINDVHGTIIYSLEYPV